MATQRYTKPIGMQQIVYDVFMPFFTKYPTMECAVFCFDKSSCVTTAKQFEQMRRDNSTSDVPQCAQTEVLPARATGRVWSQIVNHRTMRQKLISALCNEAELQIPGLLLQLKRQVQVVLDYELHHVGGCQPITRVLSDDLSSRMSPDSFANSLGEFDVTFPFYVYHPAFASHSVVVDSVDTDMLPIAMLHHTHRPKAHLWCALPMSLTTTYFDVAECAQTVQQALPTHKDPVRSICELYVQSGSDFVESCPGVSTTSFIDDYMLNFAHMSTQEYRTQLSKSQLTKLSGTKRASRAANAKRVLSDPQMCARRTEYTVNYWLHSTYEIHKLIHSPVGYGFSLQDGVVMPTEQLKDQERHKLNVKQLIAPDKKTSKHRRQ